MNKKKNAGALHDLYKQVPLAIKMLMLTIMVGTLVWFILDRVQTAQLRSIFQSQLTEKLIEHSIEDRLSFDRHVKNYQKSVKLLITQKSYIDYIDGKEWTNKGGNYIQYHPTPPVWLPNRSLLRTVIQPRFVLLLDSGGVVREVYHGGNDAPSKSLLELSRLQLLKSHNQSYMTTLDDAPYLITAESSFSEGGGLQASLVLASPIDEKMLRVALGPAREGHLAALLTTEENPVVVASNDLNKLPVGLSLKALQNDYLVTGKEFFDYGASELQIKFVSLASLADVELMTNRVVSKVRHERATLAFILILTFAAIIYRITRHISSVNMRIRDFSSHILGAKAQETREGDELHILKNRFNRLTEEVIEAREIIMEQAEEKNRLMARYSSDAIITIDRSGIIKQWNPKAESLFGWSSQETVGLMSGDTIMPPTYQSTYRESLKKGGVPESNAAINQQIQTSAFHRDGHEFPVEFSISPESSDNDGGLIAIVRDLTNLRKSEEELRKFKFISDNSSDAHFLVNRDAKFEYVNKTACRMLGYSENELLTLRVPDVDILYDIEKYQELFDMVQKDTLNPIESINKRNDGTLFPSEITVTGYRIDGENFIFAALRDITGRKKIEERISFLAQVLDTSPISVIATDKEGNITYVNPSTEKLYGYSREELFGKNPIMFNAEPNTEAIQKDIFDTINQGNVWTGELLNKNKKGNTLFLKLTVYQLLDNKGDFVALVGYQEDITERKRAEKLFEISSISTKKGDAGLDSVLDSLGMPVSMQDTDFVVLYQNRHHRDIVGDCTGQYCYKAYHGRDSVCKRCHLALAFEDGQSHQLQQSRTTDSGTRYSEITGTPVRDSKGKIIAGIEIVNDITERRKLEQEIVNMSRFPSDNPSPVLRVTNDLTILYANKASQPLLQEWESAVGKHMPEEWRELIADSIKMSSIISIEIMCRQSCILFIIYPEAKEGYVNLYGTDITDRKQVEKKLQKAKDELEVIVGKRTIELQDTVELLRNEIVEREKAEQAMRLTQFSVDHTGDAAFWMGPDARFIYVNEAASKLIGYSSEELLSMTAFDCNPSFSRVTWSEHWKEIKNRGTFTYESSIRHRDGRMVPVEITPNFIEFEGREYNCGFLRDISERKFVEEQMRTSLKEKDVLLREVHHRVKNNLQIVCSLYNLQSRYIKDREAFGMMKECQNRIRAISLVHENLYHSENMSSINFRVYVAKLISSIISFYEIKPDQIKIKLDIEDICLDLNTAIPCGLIVNEIVANSLLYAFPDGRKGEVSTVIRYSGENEIEFVLSDNGVGIPDELMKKNKQSLGLHIVDVLVKQIQGKADINNSNGTRFHLVIREGK